MYVLVDSSAVHTIVGQQWREFGLRQETSASIRPRPYKNFDASFCDLHDCESPELTKSIDTMMEVTQRTMTSHMSRLSTSSSDMPGWSLYEDRPKL